MTPQDPDRPDRPDLHRGPRRRRPGPGQAAWPCDRLDVDRRDVDRTAMPKTDAMAKTDGMKKPIKKKAMKKPMAADEVHDDQDRHVDRRDGDQEVAAGGRGCSMVPALVPKRNQRRRHWRRWLATLNEHVLTTRESPRRNAAQLVQELFA